MLVDLTARGTLAHGDEMEDTENQGLTPLCSQTVFLSCHKERFAVIHQIRQNNKQFPPVLLLTMFFEFCQMQRLTDDQRK